MIAPKTIIISAADDEYWPYLSGMLNSIDKRRRIGNIDVGVLDLGLSTENQNRLKSYGATIVVPGWDYDVSKFEEAPPSGFRAMTSRPHLPKHFPGYDHYVWIDADCWVQDWRAVNILIAESHKWGCAVVPELDRSYTPFLQNGTTFFEWAYSCFAKCCEESEAQRLAHYPLLNCGIFAASRKSPVWDAWALETGRLLDRLRRSFFFAEQTALNVCIRQQGIAAALLPARYNWMCNRATPLLSTDGKTFLDPGPPHEELAIIHMAAGTKSGLWMLTDLSGRLHQRSLCFPPLRG
jgi:hypothetical protein